MSSELDREDIDLERGDEDVAFVHTAVDMEEISGKENSREVLLEKMEERGLEVENATVIGIFRDEFSLLLEENGEIRLEGEQVYPED
ncbi:MAG: hypothetical protein ABEJ66_02315 [Candidatus Nanohaloarchaea archaeon]